MPRTTPPLPIVDQAIQWMIALQYNPADADAHARFDAWCAADPRHAAAWQQLQAVGHGLRHLPAGLTPQLAGSALGQAAPRTASRRRALKTLGASATTASLALALWLARDSTDWRPLLAGERTQRGARRRLTLADGTLLHLNADSAIDIDYTAQQRLIVLHRGEVLIATAPDPMAAAQGAARPFRVATRDGVLHALGTRFSVRLQDDGTVLSVLQDRVALYPAGTVADGAPVIAQAGQTFHLGRDGTRPLAAPDYEVGAWVDGALTVRDMPVDRLLQELARHYPGHLLHGEGLRHLTVSGTFQLDDIPRTLAFLAESLPLRIESRRRWWRDSLYITLAEQPTPAPR